MGIFDKVKKSGIAKKAVKKVNEYVNPEDKNPNKEPKSGKSLSDKK